MASEYNVLKVIYPFEVPAEVRPVWLGERGHRQSPCDLKVRCKILEQKKGITAINCFARLRGKMNIFCRVI